MSLPADVPRPAIPAAPSPLGYRLIYWLLVRPALWQSFDRVWLQLRGRLPRPADGPLVFYLNHPGWWDLYMGILVDLKLLGGRFETYGMMEEAQLRAYRFFTWCGGFSVDRHDRREAARSVAYISHLLGTGPHRALYIFPQGSITPNDRRPLQLYPGAARIVQRAGGATLCPIALRYELRGEQRPDAFIRIGPLHRASAPVDAHALTATMTERLTASADALRDAVLADDLRDFAVLLRGRTGINRVVDRLQSLWPQHRP